MDHLSMTDLKSLMLQKDGTLISLYMPTERVGDEKDQEPSRLRNLLKKAGDMLPSSGLRMPELKALLKPASDLLDDALFWQHQDKGLALFMSREGMRAYRLPVRFGEQVFMSGHFHIKPLLPLFTANGHFFLLSLGQKGVRLMYGTQDSLRDLDIPGTPPNLDQALHLEDPNIRHELGKHPGPQGSIGPIPAGYHGHGIGNDYEKPEILRFFQKIADSVHQVLHAENAPLVLSGIDFLLPIYRGANLYPFLAEGEIRKNPEAMSRDDLHRQAWDIVEPMYFRDVKEARMRYQWYAGVRSSLALSDLKDIVVAAYTGRIDTLFVSLNVRQWGWFEPDTLRVELLDEPATGAEDLLDVASVWALQNRSRVYAMDESYVPDGRAAAALCRYEL